jgi:hypothetical protein
METLRAEHISGTRLNVLGLDQAADDNACIRTLYFLGGLVCNMCSSDRNNVSIFTSYHCKSETSVNGSFVSVLLMIQTKTFATKYILLLFSSSLFNPTLSNKA